MEYNYISFLSTTEPTHHDIPARRKSDPAHWLRW